MDVDYLAVFKAKDSFSRKELQYEIERFNPTLSEANFKKILQKLLDSGMLLRVGRNAYCVAGDRRNYSYEYSATSKDIAGFITRDYPCLDFAITELSQINEFVKHLIAHNIYFLYVPGNYGEYLFDPLKSKYPGKVLLYPDEITFNRYWSDDVIVIQRLVSQSPMDKTTPWHARPEKILVDLFADKILASTIDRSELPNIYNGMFKNYAIDESSLFRYAGRRNVKDKIQNFISTETKVRLRTVNSDAEQR